MDLHILEHYTLGIEHLDKEHLELFTLVNTILNNLDDRSGYLERIEDFRRKCRSHYTGEDAYMLQIGYPYYDMHHLEHLRIMQDLREQIYTITAYATLKIYRNYIHDMSNAFLRHIDTYDMQLADYVKKNPHLRNIIPIA